MSAHPTIDPELLELLREISADPKSRLMKLATQGVDTRIGLRERPISGGEPFLTRAERHLVREHREQVAYLLYKAAQRAILAAPQEESLVLRKSAPGMDVEVPAAQWFGSQLSRALAAVPADDEALNMIGLFDGDLREATSSGYGAKLTAAQLRLCPRDSARNHMAMSQVLQGRQREGIEGYKDILRSRPSSTCRSIASQNLAFEHLLDGELRPALDLYRDASLASRLRPEPIFGWLHTSLCLCDRPSALIASAHLSESLSESMAECLQEHVYVWETQKRKGVFIPTSQQTRFSRSMLDHLPQPAARLARLFFES